MTTLRQLAYEEREELAARPGPRSTMTKDEARAIVEHIERFRLSTWDRIIEDGEAEDAGAAWERWTAVHDEWASIDGQLADLQDDIRRHVGGWETPVAVL